MLKAFRRIIISDVTLSRLQDAITDYVGQITPKPQLDSNIINNVTLSSSKTVQIPHLLGRKFIGWHLIDLETNSVVWRDTNEAHPEAFLTLKCSANCVVSVLVF